MTDKDFLGALEDAQKMPDLSDTNPDTLIPDVLAGMVRQQMVTRIEADTPGKITGAKSYDFDFHCARLVIGQVEAGFQNGRPIYEDKDDSDKLKEIMDMHLRGEAIVHNKKETFLKDGTVILWVEWMLPRKPPPKAERGYLTTEELLSPEPSKDKQDDSGDK